MFFQCEWKMLSLLIFGQHPEAIPTLLVSRTEMPSCFSTGINSQISATKLFFRTTTKKEEKKSKNKANLIYVRHQTNFEI